MSIALSLPPLMTADEFAVWPGDGVGRRHQLIDGEPVAMNASSWRHGAICAALAQLLVSHLRASGSRCVVVIEPGIQPRAGASTNIRIPDLAVSGNPGSGHWLDQPILIVEILSPSNVRETREAVRAYLTIPSVQEVLVVDSVAIRAELLRRGADGAWPAEPTVWNAGDTISLDSLGFRCELAGLYPP